MATAARRALHRLLPHPVPPGVKAGVLIVAVGLALDTYVHLYMDHSTSLVIAGFSLPEHFAHLLVLIGMLVVLSAVIAVGVRSGRAQHRDSKGETHAVR